MQIENLSKHSRAAKEAWENLKAAEGDMRIPASEVQRRAEVLVAAITAFQKEAGTPEPALDALAS